MNFQCLYKYDLSVNLILDFFFGPISESFGNKIILSIGGSRKIPKETVDLYWGSGLMKVEAGLSQYAASVFLAGVQPQH